MQRWMVLCAVLAAPATTLAQTGPASADVVEEAPPAVRTDAQLESDYLAERLAFAKTFFKSANDLDGASIYNAPKRRLRTQLSRKAAAAQAPLRPVKIDVRLYTSAVADVADLSPERAKTFQYVAERLMPALQSTLARSVRVRLCAILAVAAAGARDSRSAYAASHAGEAAVGADTRK